MKKLLIILLMCVIGLGAKGQVSQEAFRQWHGDKYSMFIHFGLYSQLGGVWQGKQVKNGYSEQIQAFAPISKKDYEKIAGQFNPTQFNADSIAVLAKKAGMHSIILTSKHHDGFCLFKTATTSFNSYDATPCKRDFVKEISEATRRHGLRFGLYYSLIDWHHPDFTYDRQHPNGPHDPKERAEANKSRDMDKYRQYMKNQLTELLTQYGQIDELFLDFSYPGKDGKGHEDWDSEGLIKLARELQPQIIINNRSDLQDTSWGWDFLTPEQYVPYEGLKINGESVPWEMCQTFDGRSWGYSRDGQTWKSARQLIVMLIEAVSKGGNLLLNVGPTARGEFEPRAVERLEAIAEWMKYHSRSIYGCTQAPAGIEAPNNCLLTYNPETNRLYVHVLEWPFKSLHLPGLEGKIKYAQLLNDASEMTYYSRTAANAGEHTVEISRAGDLIMPVPVRKPDVEVPVIEIMLE